MLDDIKILLGIPKDDEAKDDLLNLYIKRVTEQVSNYLKNKCGLTEIPEEAYGIIQDLVVIKYRNKGGEGRKNEKLGDESIEYDLFPKHIQKELDFFTRMKVI